MTASAACRQAARPALSAGRSRAGQRMPDRPAVRPTAPSLLHTGERTCAGSASAQTTGQDSSCNTNLIRRRPVGVKWRLRCQNRCESASIQAGISHTGALLVGMRSNHPTGLDRDQPHAKLAARIIVEPLLAKLVARHRLDLYALVLGRSGNL